MDQFLTDNKRIAKNTIVLYGRMLVTLLVSLYTSRAVLQVLGFQDYGIYNVVGGVVAMFGFLSSSLSASSQRYITFALGKGDTQCLSKVFNVCFLSHFLIAILIIVLIETVGLWFFHNKLVIPEDRLNSAFWILQFSSISSFIAIIRVPYDADIIAHEKIKVFACVSLADVFLNLAIVCLLKFGTYDKLLLYGILQLFSKVLVFVFFSSYCRHHYFETKFQFSLDFSLFREVFTFGFWNVMGNLAGIMSTQGVNILLNIFFGPSVNAARAVAVQLDNTIVQFASNFQTALNPQITKNYASNNLNKMHDLICKSSRYSFLLLYIFCLPLFFEAPFVLDIWLDDVPDFSAQFVRIMLFIILVDTTSNPFMVSASATGRVKKYQLVVGGIILLIVPISYIILKFGGSPISVFYVHLLISVLAFVTRLIIVQPMIQLDIYAYIHKVIFPLFSVCLLSFILPFFFTYILKESVLNSILIIIISFISATICGFYFGLTRSEKTLVRNKLVSFLRNTHICGYKS